MDDKTLGYILFIGSLFGVGCYFYLMFISPWGLLVLQASVFLAVAAAPGDHRLDRLFNGHRAIGLAEHS